MRGTNRLALVVAGASLLLTAQHAVSASPALPPSHSPSRAGIAPEDTFIALNWIDAQRGWALVDSACAHGTCGVVYATQNGGRDWRRRWIGPSEACSSTRWCANHMLVVTPRIGYLYEPGLLMTTDGGRGWSPVLGRQVEAMAVAGSWVYRLTYQGTGCPGPCRTVLQRSTAGSRTWTDVPGWRDVSQGFGDGFVASGQDLYTVFYGHPAGGADSAHATLETSRDDGRSWQVRADPCGSASGHEEDTLALAAHGSSLGILCSARTERGPSFVVYSPNGGQTFARTAPLPRDQWTQLAVGVGGEIAVGSASGIGCCNFPYELAGSAHGGRTWRIAVRDREPLTDGAGPGSLQFTSATSLWWSDPYRAWQSLNGGRTWRWTAAP